MPSSRSLSVMAAIERKLEQMAVSDGFVVRHFDVSLETFNTHEQAIIVVRYRGREIWRKTLCSVQRLCTGTEAEVCNMATSLMEKTLSLAGQVYLARLSERFPKSIASVDMEYVVETGAKRAIVRFKNGHVLDEWESALMSDEFIAKCVMVYDLPPL